MVDNAAIACCRAALRGSSGTWSAIISIMSSSRAAKCLARLGALAGDLGAERRHRTAMAGIVAVDRRKIRLHDRRKALFRRGPLGELAPALGGTVHRVVERLDHQRLARGEMGVEAAMRQPGLLHQVSDADAMGALLAQPHRGLAHDALVGFLLVFLGITHGSSIRCL